MIRREATFPPNIHRSKRFGGKREEKIWREKDPKDMAGKKIQKRKKDMAGNSPSPP